MRRLAAMWSLHRNAGLWRVRSWSKLRVQMRREIRELQKRLAITTVYVTHDQEEAMAVSDRIAVMNQGSIVQQGTAEDLYQRPASEFVAQFIGRVNLVAGRVISVSGATLEADVTQTAALYTRATQHESEPGILAVSINSSFADTIWAQRGSVFNDSSPPPPPPTKLVISTVPKAP